MSYFYVKACPNGHYDINNRRLKEGETCEQCGQPLMDKCPECGGYIRKWTLYGATPILPWKKDYELPSLCPHCGKPIPWAHK